MKSAYACILSYLLILLPLVCSCGKGDGDSSWTPAGGEIDSLTVVLDSLCHTEAPKSEFSSAVCSLERAASRSKGDAVAQARAQYWRAYMIERYATLDSAGYEAFLSLLADARLSLDSAASPYDMARLRSLEANALPPDQAIKAYLESYEAFVDAHDYHSAAGSMFNMAYIYQHFGDYASADICYEKSIGMMEKVQPVDTGKYIRAWNHRAIMHRNMGDTVGAIEFARKVSEMDYYDVSDKVLSSTERILYYDRHDIRHLRNALRSARRLGWEDDVVPLFLSHFLTCGPRDSIEYWKEATLSLRVPPGETFNKMARAGALRDYYIRCGSDSASLYGDSLRELSAEWNSIKGVIDGHEAIRRAMLENYIDRFDKKSQDMRRRTVYLLIAVAVIILLGAGLAIRLVIKRSRQTQAVLSADKDVATVATRLAAALTTDMSPAEEWETFKVIFAQSNPGFQERLLKKHPGLTPGEYRLACLIRTSIDNKHIARLMGISPASVYTNRFRLRQKLGLDSDTNLDIYLLRL